MKSTPCKSCGAQIIWVRTSADRPMPLDAQPSERGNVLIRDGRAYVLSGPTPGGRTAHHATCPQANQWRKPRGAQPAQPTLDGSDA